MAEFAAIPFFTDAWIADTAHLSRTHRGIYLDLLVLMWRSPECRVPNEISWIAHKLSCQPEEIEPLKNVIAEFCQSTGNWLTQKRLLKEFVYVRKNTQRQSDAAKSRWRKHKKHASASKRHASGNAPTPTPTPTPTPSRKKGSKEGANAPLLEGLEIVDDVDEFVRLWNEMAEEIGVPTVDLPINQDRRKAIPRRLHELGGLGGWAICLEKIRGGPLLTGQKTDWSIYFDWILKPANLTKVMEGNYDVRKTANNHPKPGSRDDNWNKAEAVIAEAVRRENGGGEPAGEEASSPVSEREGGTVVHLGDHRVPRRPQ